MPPPPTTLDETRHVRFFANFGLLQQEMDEETGEIRAILGKLAEERPHLRVEFCDLVSRPRLFHEHLLSSVRVVRAYRADGRQVDCPELRALLPHTWHLEDRPNAWTAEQHGLRKRDLPAPAEELEYTDLARLKNERLKSSLKEKSFEYHDVKSGETYGPFTPGFATAIYNLVDARGRATLERTPVDREPFDEAEMERERDRLLADLADARARELHGDLPLPPVLWNGYFAAGIGLAYAGWQPWLGGVQLRYVSAGDTSATVAEVPRREASFQAGTRTFMADLVAEWSRIAEEEKFRDFFVQPWARSKPGDGEETFSCAFDYCANHQIGGRLEWERAVDWVALRAIGPRWAVVCLRLPACHGGFEQRRFSRFASLGFAEMRKAERCRSGRLT